MIDKYSQFDVTIVGAGPAGSILAYELARQGVKVLLLEKAKLPRKKVCAGGITVRASSLLPFDISEVVEDTIYGSRLSFHFSRLRVRTYDRPLAYMVMREKFDYLLASRAEEAGAKLEDGVEVQNIEETKKHVLVKTDDDSFTTPILVGADGANSTVVRSLGLRPGFEYGLGLSCQIAVNREKLWKLDGLIGLDLGIPGGYAWVFPKKHCLSIGAGGSFREIKKLKSYTSSLIHAYGLHAPDGHTFQSHLMPLRKKGTPLGRERILLVGDAAGLIDPLSGEGIYYALKSSYLATRAIRNFMEGKSSDLVEYERGIDRELMPEFKIARTIQKVNSVAPCLFFHYLSTNDRFWRAFCRMLRGEKTYAGIKKSLGPLFGPVFRYI
jgi:geranylgeranyl reductase family protein